MLKRISIIILLVMVIIGMCSSTNAADFKTNLNIIQKASKTKYLENDQGYISKTIVDSDKDKGEVTIELKLSNTKKEVEKNEDTEIFLVIDNSISMDYNATESSTRKLVIGNSATS